MYQIFEGNRIRQNYLWNCGFLICSLLLKWLFLNTVETRRYTWFIRLVNRWEYTIIAVAMVSWLSFYSIWRWGLQVSSDGGLGSVGESHVDLNTWSLWYSDFQILRSLVFIGVGRIDFLNFFRSTHFLISNLVCCCLLFVLYNL